MKVTRQVLVEADDKSRGMTAAELRNILSRVPDEMVPTVIIGLRGRIRAMRFQMEFDDAR